MGDVSQFERLQIESVLMNKPGRIERACALFVFPKDLDHDSVFDLAVLPALQKNELTQLPAQFVFDDQSSLSEICAHVQAAELIIIDVSVHNPYVLYVLGLCHGLGRCPILLTHQPDDVPFNLFSLRCVEYEPTREGLMDLRERLERTFRVFLAASRATGGMGDLSST
jgi:hypothetical protein